MTRLRPLGEYLDEYIALRRSLGYAFNAQADTLRAFGRFWVEQGHDGTVTQDIALAFASASAAGRARRARRYQVVRDFADYLSALVPGMPRMQRRPIGATFVRPVPYVLTEAEVSRLLTHARAHRSRGHGTFCGLTYFTIFGLAVSTGMREGEVARLRRSDVQTERATIRIVNTKFGKSRLVALHPTTIEVLRDYARARDATMAHTDCDAFFVSLKLRSFDPASLSLAFSKVRQGAELDERATFHSLRHTFAVNCLVRWYREGKDVNALLPALATYLGHVHYTSTAYYLTATAELLELAAGRLTGGGNR